MKGNKNDEENRDWLSNIKYTKLKQTFLFFKKKTNEMKRATSDQMYDKRKVIEIR